MGVAGYKRRSNADPNICIHVTRVQGKPVLTEQTNTRDGKVFSKIFLVGANNSAEFSTKATGYLGFFATGKIAERIAAMDLEKGDEIFTISKYHSKTLHGAEKGKDVYISEFQITYLVFAKPGAISLAKYSNGEQLPEPVGDPSELFSGVRFHEEEEKD